MRQISAAGIAVLGSAVIAITYGLARFVLGLFMPVIRDELALDASAAGVIGALPFVSFIAAVLIAPRLSEWLGPRNAGVLTAGVAMSGLLLVAGAPGAIVLGVAVAICGISTGLSSPVMADAVHSAVTPTLRGRVNAVHNAGTSLGVALAMPISAYLLGDWRAAYLSFALLAALAAIAMLRWLPPNTATAALQVGHAPHARMTQAQRRGISALAVLAVGMGVTSSIYWVFAPDMVTRHGGLPDWTGSWMWLGIGVVGLLGGAAGDLMDRLGTARTHGLALGLLALALALLAWQPDALLPGLTSAAIFGAAYMTLTGLYLVQGIRILSNRPALGPVLPFLAVACGQAVGSPVAGWTIEHAGYPTAFAAFALIGLMLVAVALAGRLIGEWHVPDTDWKGPTTP